ncbi:MAG TPA: D-alanyl-D-alanine carboxypeptidase family protein [Clostridia bacterium]|nr:D-alanyl-D-alanine carboxypeptidase family protein [Clostridia bacterium]
MFLKKIIATIIAVITMFIYLSLFAWSVEPAVAAECAALMCVETGEILYQQNAHKKHLMASTTKIMTALLAIEAGCPEKAVKVTDKMVKVEGTSMGLLDGDKVTVRALIYGMLLKSGNDAANVTAYIFGGDIEKFASMMNERAKEIGMNNTNFVTPSGLDHEEHYSTAYDMALLGCEAIKNVEFKEACSTKSARFSYGNPPYIRMLTSHNRLLHSYSGCIGIKTGFTKKSGRCLVSAAQRDGVTLVAVTLNSKSDWKDHTKMLDYGFTQVSVTELNNDLSNVDLQIFGGEKRFISVRCVGEPKAVYRIDEDVIVEKRVLIKQFEFAPISQGKIVGSVEYYKDNKLVCEVPIVTNESVNIKKVSEPTADNNGKHIGNIINQIKDFFRRG